VEISNQFSDKILNEFSRNTLPPLLHLTLSSSLLVVVVAEEGQMPLGTLVREMPGVPALETSDLIQSLESTRVTVCPAHRMHSVI